MVDLLPISSTTVYDGQSLVCFLQRSASGRSMIMCGQFLLQVVHHCDTVLYQYIDLVQFNDHIHPETLSAFNDAMSSEDGATGRKPVSTMSNGTVIAKVEAHALKSCSQNAALA
jgi:hypothetical protein